jgi:hypothetical protein
MKTRNSLCFKVNCLIGWSAVVIVSATCNAQQVQTVPAAVSGEGDYVVTQVGPHSQVWQNSVGQSVTEIATGMNYWDGLQWTPSDPSFQVSADGTSFVAAKIQDPTQLAVNLNCVGAVTVTTPDNVTLSSTPIAIGLYDAASGKSVIVASLTNSTGVLVDPQDVVYDKAFVGGGFAASVVYSLPDTGSFHQDVVFTGFDPGFDPTVWGFAAASTNTLQIQIYTEFYDPPQPDVLERPIYVEQDPAVRASMASPDLIDYTLDFGDYVFGPGRAYTTGTNDIASAGVQVAKDFVTSSGRTFLVESIPYRWLEPGLQSLPPVQVSSLKGVPGAKRTRVAAASVPSLREVKKGSIEKHIPAKTTALACAKPHGVVIDYVVTVSSTTSLTVYASDTTYFVTNTVYESSAVTIENCVFKFPTNNSASLVLEGTVTMATTSYRPAVFTAADDSTAGATLSTNMWSGYTGNPTGKYYGNPALWLNTGGNVALNNLRFCYARVGIEISANASGQVSTLSHSELVDCITGIYIAGGSGCGCGCYHTFALNANNCLMANVQYPLQAYEIDLTGTARNCTIDSSAILFDGTSTSGTLSFTNSILSGVATNIVGTLSFLGGYNGFYNSPTFGSSQTSTTNSPYQSVGAGNYYLAPGSPFLTAGTTNIGAALLSQLQAKTTQAPLVITNCFTTNTVLMPAVQRDTAGPALGFHYDPIDYITACSVSNATLFLTNGVALAYYDNLGIWLQDGSQLDSQGTPNYRNFLVYYNLVQEQPGVVTNTLAQALPIAPLPFGLTEKPSISLRLTTICAPTGETNLLNTGDSNQVISSLTLRDCEVYGAGANWQMNESNNTPDVGFTNNVFHRTPFAINSNAKIGTFNNLFYGTTNVSVTNTIISIRYRSGTSPNTNENNVFDGVTASLDGVVGYNAYLHGATNTAYTNNHDIWTNITWLAGPLGNYYQATNGPLINNGSTSATNLGLYHYTVMTNNVVEGTNIVSLGYHYVAVGTNGLPLVSNTNGVPDYLADANGNGLIDSGETPWYDVPEIITQPLSQVVLRGSNATFSAIAGGTAPLAYQWRFDGTNISDATSSYLTITNVQTTNVGSYTVVVANAFGSITSSVATLNIAGTIKWMDYLGSLGGDLGAPAVGPNGDVYILNAQGLFSLNGTNGATNWADNLFSSGEMSPYQFSPTVSPNGTIYVGLENTLYSINPDGTTNWTNAFSAADGVYPAIANDGTIIVSLIGSYGLYAINTNGTIKWSSACFSSGGFDPQSAPAIGPDCTIYCNIGSGDYWLGAFYPDGSLKWVLPWYLGNTAPPAVAPDGSIFVGTTDGEDGYSYLLVANPNGTINWAFNSQVGNPISSPPAVGSDGTAYFAADFPGDTGVLWAVTNGQRAWALTNEGSYYYPGNFGSAAIGADNLVYIGSPGLNAFYAIANGVIEWGLTNSDWGGAESPPVIAPDGTILFGTEGGYLAALYSPTPPATNAWPMFAHDAGNTGSAATADCASEDCTTPVPYDGILNPGGPFTFQLQGPSNSTWTVYVSSDGLNWGLATNSGSASVPLSATGEGSFSDDDITGYSNRFYYLNNGTCSSEVIGFTSLSVLPGTNLITDPLYQCDENWLNSPVMNTLNGLFGYEYYYGGHETMPPGQTIVQEWNGVQFNNSTNESTSPDSQDWSPNPDAMMLPGQSVFMLNPPYSNAFTLWFTGIVPKGPLSLNIQPGTNYLSSMVPMAGPISSVMNYTPNEGDQIGLWIPTNSSTTNILTEYTYSSTGWSPSEPFLQIGQGFVLVTSNNFALAQSWNPVIVVPPVSQTNNPLGSTTFSVVATGAGTLGYQWAVNSTSILNATSASYTIDPVYGTSAGTYSVTVSNAFGTASASATLYVSPEIIVQPTNSNFTIAGLALTGSLPFAYQWMSNNMAIAGATNSTYSASAGPPARYTALVTNVAGSVVTTGVAVSWLPANGTLTQVANPLDEVVLAAPSGTNYQWEWNRVTLCGQTSSNLMLLPTDATNAGTYTVITTTESGQSISSNILSMGPEVVVQAQDCITPFSSNASFSTTAIGTPPFSYQWQFNGTNLLGATNSLLVVTNTLHADVGSYTVILSSELPQNAYSITSDYAMLTVTEPIITTLTNNVFAEPGGTVMFTNLVLGTPGMGYQWYKQFRTNALGTWNTNNLTDGITNDGYVLATVSGATSNILTLTGVSNTDSGVYQQSVYSPATAMDRVGQEINLYVDPAITSQPQNQIIDVGTSSVTFSVGVWSSNPTDTSYQWMSNNVNIPGANGTNFTLYNVTTNDAASYSVMVSNSSVHASSTSSQWAGILSVRTPIWLTTNTNHANLVSNFQFATTNGTMTNWYCVTNAGYYMQIITSTIPHVVHYDAGTFQTLGSQVGNTAQAGWQHWGTVINGTNATTLQLACTNVGDYFIFAAYNPQRTDGFQLYNLILDCNANNPSLRVPQYADAAGEWAGVNTAGNNMVVSNVTFIHFGQQIIENFPLIMVPYEMIDENGRMITICSNMSVANCLFTEPATNNGPGGGLTAATLLSGYSWADNGIIIHITNSSITSCVESNLSSDFGWCNGFTAFSVQNCTVYGGEAAVYWEIANPVYYGETAVIQSNYFTNVWFGFLLSYNGSDQTPLVAGSLTIQSNVIVLTNAFQYGGPAYEAGVDINGGDLFPFPQIPSLTARYNYISTATLGYPRWGFYLWNISNAVVTDNVIDSPTNAITVYKYSLQRQPVSFLVANHNATNGSGLMPIYANDLDYVTGWAGNVIGTQQKGDFNLDGQTDLLWRSATTGQNVFWFMNGTNWDGCSNGLPSMPTNWAISGTADFTGDCNNDILWTMPGTTNILLWVMEGPSFISSNWLPALPGTNYGIAGTGDFNGDGKTDLVLTNSTANQFIIWLMNGTNLLSTNRVSATWPGTTPQLVGAGPFTGGEQADVLFRDSTGANYVWEMSGTVYPGISSQIQLASTNTSWQVQGVGDFNGDGIADILWRNPSSGSNVIWLTSSALGSTYTNVVLANLAGSSWIIGGPR